MARFKGHEWDLAGQNGNIGTWEKVQVAVLMDLRDELQKLNRLLGCPNFTGIPTTLRAIHRATSAKRKRRAV